MQLFTYCQPVMCLSQMGTPSCCVWQGVDKGKSLGMQEYTRKCSHLAAPPLNAVAETAIPTSPPRSRCACPLTFLASVTVKALCFAEIHLLSLKQLQKPDEGIPPRIQRKYWSGFRKDHMWISEPLWHMSSYGTMQASKFRMQQPIVGCRTSWLGRLVCRINFQSKLEYH